MTVSELAYGGDAVGRLGDGKVCFVPYGAPGDELRIVRADERKSYVRGRIDALLRPGPGRVEPRCPRFGDCGGCAWQHLDYAAQCAAKAQQATDLLARGPESVALEPLVAAPDPWHYRSRITLSLEGGAVGYHAAASTRVVAAPDCALAVPELDARLAALQSTLAAPFAAAGLNRLELRAGLDGRVDANLWHQTPRRGPRGRRDTPPAAALAALGRALELHGVAVAGDSAWGEPGIRVAAGTLALDAGPGVFTQVHAAINAELVARVVAALADGDGPVLDLYGGIGNFALPLAAAGHTVVGLEAHPRAVADAAANAARLGLAERAHFVRADLGTAAGADAGFAAARTALDGRAPAAVVLDPPRAGAVAALPPLIAAAPRHVVYVSCHPPAFVRDWHTLAAAGYRLQSAVPLDMFPQTGHFELLAVLERDNAAGVEA